MYVRYINEYTFDVYTKDEFGFLTPVILDAECHDFVDTPDKLWIRTDHHIYIVDYFMDAMENNKITQLDYEGSPINLNVKKTFLSNE